MPKVFHLLPEGERFSEFHGGAISRWVANVLRGDAAGVVVCVDADASWGYPAGNVMSMAWLHRYSAQLRMTGHRVPWWLRKRLLGRGFSGMVGQLRPGDTVWVHNRPEAAAALCVPVHRAGGHVVLHMHNAHLQTASAQIIEELDMDRIVYVSGYLKEASQSALTIATMGEVLYNGADGALFQPKAMCGCAKAARPMRVLFAGRLVKEKGPHLLVEALRQLQRAGVAVEGTIVGGVEFGDSTPDAYVESLRQDAPANLSFHPYCAGTELARLFQQADVFCLPSVWHDPFPLAPLEAMAAGLPVVASRSGGIPEALFDGGGILIERDSAAALADALQWLAEDPMLRQRLAAEARQSFVRNFQWSHVQENYAAIVRRVVDA